MRVATKANPSKGGDAKPRGYSPERSARGQASRVAERTQGGVYAAQPMEHALRARDCCGCDAGARVPSSGWSVRTIGVSRHKLSSVELESCHSRRVHRGLQLESAGCGS